MIPILKIHKLTARISIFDLLGFGKECRIEIPRLQDFSKGMSAGDISSSQSFFFSYWSLLGLVVDDGSGTRAAHGDDFLLQAVGGLAAPRLSPEDEDLLLDGDGVEAVVLLPQRVHAAGVAALGISDHLGEAVGVFIKPGDGNRKGLYALAQHGLVGCSCLPPRKDHALYLCIAIVRQGQTISLFSTFFELVPRNWINFGRSILPGRSLVADEWSGSG